MHTLNWLCSRHTNTLIPMDTSGDGVHLAQGYRPGLVTNYSSTSCLQKHHQVGEHKMRLPDWPSNCQTQCQEFGNFYSTRILHFHCQGAVGPPVMLACIAPQDKGVIQLAGVSWFSYSNSSRSHYLSGGQATTICAKELSSKWMNVQGKISSCDIFTKTSEHSAVNIIERAWFKNCEDDRENH